MSEYVEVRFEDPPGTLHPTLQFIPGQSVRVTGTVRTLFGLPSPFLTVDLDIFDSFAPMSLQTLTNVAGNYWFDIVLPSVVSLATVRVVAHFIGGVEVTQVTIGIGTSPPPPPGPPKGLLDKLMPWLIGAGVALAAMYAAPVLVPLGKEAVRSVKGAIR